jgi:hypothetical protein
MDAQGRKEVSESAYEYLLGEIIARESVTTVSGDPDSQIEKRLEVLGYNVGYRYIFFHALVV